MLNCITFIILAAPWPSSPTALPGSVAQPITVGWHDEMNRPANWGPLKMENIAKTSVPVHGCLRLDLGQVPQGWPYEYQWSGVTRRANVDIARFPYLSAYVSQLLGGYAHLDLDVLDARGKPVKTFRSSTLQAGGVTAVDLTPMLDPAVYILELRLIVGGSNAGCWATYNWVRFTSVEDGRKLLRWPHWREIREDRVSRNGRIIVGTEMPQAHGRSLVGGSEMHVPKLRKSPQGTNCLE